MKRNKKIHFFLYIQIDFRCSSCFHFGELFHFDLFLFHLAFYTYGVYFQQILSLLLLLFIYFFFFFHLAIFIVLLNIRSLSLFSSVWIVFFHFDCGAYSHTVYGSNEHWQRRHTYGMQSMPIASKKKHRKKDETEVFAEMYV